LGATGLDVVVMSGVALVALAIWMDRPRRARWRQEAAARANSRTAESATRGALVAL